jgi:prophage regulatory protein
MVRFVATKELRTRWGIAYSRSQIFRKVKAGSFPEPVKLGANRSAFVESEIAEWVAARIAERDKSTSFVEVAR